MMNTERNCNKSVDDIESNISDISGKRIFLKHKWNYFREYCTNSSVHGMKYLGEPRRTMSERIWWITIFVISISCCGIQISSIWFKWQNNPVIVTFSDKPMPVWQIPFPAITVCPESKCRSDLFNLTEVLFNSNISLTKEDNETLAALSMLCDNMIVDKFQINKTTNSSIVPKLEEIVPPMTEIFTYCVWGNYNGPCEKLFSKIITEDGVCFSFNILSQPELFHQHSIQDEYLYVHEMKNSKGWSLEHGYPEDSTVNTYPYRGRGAGTNFQLQVYLKAQRNQLDYICNFGNQGYKILMHHPADMPRISQQFFRLPHEEEVVVTVKPNVMITSEGLKAYDPHRRQCFFPSERRLSFYKTYTQGNCELECLTNYTLKRCGCVMFSMPRNNSTPICRLEDLICKRNAQNELLIENIPVEMKKKLLPSDDDNSDCDCLPSCTSIQYEAELSQAPMELKVIGSLLPEHNISFGLLSRLSIYFREPQIITSHRSELYGQSEFVANCGGLLGLFMGVSILSVVEIIYFASLRLICSLRTKLTNVGNISKNI